jgi:hypothetical protein
MKPMLHKGLTHCIVTYVSLCAAICHYDVMDIIDIFMAHFTPSNWKKLAKLPRNKQFPIIVLRA